VTTPAALNWTEGLSSVLACISVGGYPPPAISILTHANNTSTDITRRFSMSHSATLDGVAGLRVITYVSERYSIHPIDLAAVRILYT